MWRQFNLKGFDWMESIFWSIFVKIAKSGHFLHIRYVHDWKPSFCMFKMLCYVSITHCSRNGLNNKAIKMIRQIWPNSVAVFNCTVPCSYCCLCLTFWVHSKLYYFLLWFVLIKKMCSLTNWKTIFKTILNNVAGI